MSTQSTSPDRPRPQYGEYATPEQLATARGLTLEQLQHQMTPPRAEAPAAGDAVVVPPAQSTDAAKSPTRRRTLNRAVTIGLLAFGLLYTLLNTPGLLALSETMQRSYDLMGYGEFVATERVASLGVLAAVLQGVVWLATAAVSFLLLRRGRAAWWVPVAGGVLALIVFVVVSTIVLAGDPTFLEIVNQGR